jgi:hypothetical protein
MADEESHFAFALTTRTSHHLQTEWAKSASGVEDDLLVAFGHLDTRRVPAVRRTFVELARGEKSIQIGWATGIAVRLEEVALLLFVLIQRHRRR